VKQLLAFSRRQQREATPLDLDAALGRAEPMLRQLVGPDITFEVRTGGVPAVAMDEQDFTRLLTGAIVWSRDLLRLGGHITVDTTVSGHDAAPVGRNAAQVVLTVAAEGYGMADSPLPPAIEAMAARCGGSVRTGQDAGRLEVTFG
jgi:signal transduction histidine kinase